MCMQSSTKKTSKQRNTAQRNSQSQKPPVGMTIFLEVILVLLLLVPYICTMWNDYTNISYNI